MKTNRLTYNIDTLHLGVSNFRLFIIFEQSGFHRKMFIARFVVATHRHVQRPTKTTANRFSPQNYEYSTLIPINLAESHQIQKYINFVIN